MGKEAQKFNRPIYRVKSLSLEAEDRVFHFPQEDPEADTQREEVKVGDELLLMDLLTVSGTSVYTLMKLDENKEKVYVADFYENELEVSGKTHVVEFEWLEAQRQLLLQ